MFWSDAYNHHQSERCVLQGPSTWRSLSWKKKTNVFQLGGDLVGDFWWVRHAKSGMQSKASMKIAVFKHENGWNKGSPRILFWPWDLGMNHNLSCSSMIYWFSQHCRDSDFHMCSSPPLLESLMESSVVPSNFCSWQRWWTAAARWLLQHQPRFGNLWLSSDLWPWKSRLKKPQVNSAFCHCWC